MAAPNSKENGKAIILVVDRDPHVRELESHFLHQAGYSVEFAQSGESALEQIEIDGRGVRIVERRL